MFFQPEKWTILDPHFLGIMKKRIFAVIFFFILFSAGLIFELISIKSPPKDSVFCDDFEKMQVWAISASIVGWGTTYIDCIFAWCHEMDFSMEMARSKEADPITPSWVLVKHYLGKLAGNNSFEPAPDETSESESYQPEIVQLPDSPTRRNSDYRKQVSVTPIPTKTPIDQRRKSLSAPVLTNKIQVTRKNSIDLVQISRRVRRISTQIQTQPIKVHHFSIKKRRCTPSDTTLSVITSRLVAVTHVLFEVMQHFADLPYINLLTILGAEEDLFKLRHLSKPWYFYFGFMFSQILGSVGYFKVVIRKCYTLREKRLEKKQIWKSKLCEKCQRILDKVDYENEVDLEHWVRG